MVSKVDQLSTGEILKKKSQLLQLVDSRFFVDFAADFHRISVGNGRIRTKWPQNLQKIPSKSTVDYVADPILQQFTFFEKLSTLLKKIQRLSTSQKKIPQ
jgi:hypothetical protein